MSLVVTEVEYHDFRNMQYRKLQPAEGLTILVGPNAAGKTNCVEGIHLLTCGKTFRHTQNMLDLVREGASAARVSLQAKGEQRVLDISCDIIGGKKVVTVNGKKRRPSSLTTLLSSVLFSPDDLMVIKGSATGRRDLIDDMGAQLNETYARLLRDYGRALTQRNALLREEVPNHDLIYAWTDSLVTSGAMLALYRQSLLRRLIPYITEAYQTVASHEQIDVSYVSAYAQGCEDRTSMERALRAAIDASRVEELGRRMTVVGPHRDDIELSISGRSARLFGSQGQQRTLVLALKLAQVHLIREICETYPIFLLDDVMSELDARRREALFTLISGGVQTIVTTTNLSYFTTNEVGQASVVVMGSEQ